MIRRTKFAIGFIIQFSFYFLVNVHVVAINMKVAYIEKQPAASIDIK